MWKTYGKLFLIQNWKKYIIVVLLIVVQCRFFQSNVEVFSRIANKTYEISISDYIADFYRGTAPFAIHGSNETFNIPPIWSLYFIYFFAVISRFISRSFHKYESQLMLRCVTRKKWWRYQSLGIATEIMGYLMVTFLTFFLYAFFTGATVWGLDVGQQVWYSGIDLSQFSGLEFAANTVLISFFVMMALAYLQYVISIKGNVVIGMIVPVIILISSVFYKNPLLLCNYLMLIRGKKLMPGGMNIWIGVLICVLIVGFMYLLGRKLIEKKDLY